MRALARFSIKNPVLVHLLVLALLVVGFYALRAMPRELVSDIAFQWVFVRIDHPGVAAQEIEEQIALPLEDALATVGDIRNYSSRSKENYVFAMVRFEQLDTVGFDRAYQELKDAVDAVALPDEALDPVVWNFSSDDFQPMVQVVVSGDLPDARLFDITERLRDDILDLDGIGRVQVSGLREREVRVEVDPDRLDAHGMSLSQVAAALATANASVPGGVLDRGTSELLLRATGRFDQLEDMETVVLGASPQGGLVRLLDVATVENTWEEPDILSRYEGEPSLTLSITKEPEGNALDLIELIRGVVDNAAATEDARARFDVTGDTSRLIDEILGDLESNALFGMVLVVLVLWLFLGLRNALVTALGIPLAFLATFIFMWASGESLNGNSLFGLVLVLGIIVDDAIVLVENCARHQALGKSRVEAIVDGVAEVAVPVVAAILTTIAAFLPLMLVPGIMGRFMRIVPLVVTMALVASLAEALVSLPCHVHEWGDPDPERMEARSARFAPFAERYLRPLRWLVAGAVPRPGERSGTRRTLVRALGYAAGTPLVALAGMALGAGASIGLAGGFDPDAVETIAQHAAIGGAGAIGAVLLLSALLRRDLLGEHGLPLFNLAGLAATGLLVLGFLPSLAFMGFGQGVATAVGATLVVGPLLVVGGLAARGALRPLLARFWGRLRHIRYTVFAAVYLGMVPLAITLAGVVGLDLFQGEELPQVTVHVRMPEGTGLETTDGVIRRMEARAREHLPPEELAAITANAGLLQTQTEWFIKSSVGQLVIDLEDDHERTLDEIMADLRPVLARVPGPDSIEIGRVEQGPPTGGDVELKIQGPELDRLVQLSETVAADLAAQPGVVDVRSDWVLGKEELRVEVDPERAALYGLREDQVGLLLRQAFEGIEATTWQDGDEGVPVMVRYEAAARTDVERVQRLRVPLGDGRVVPLMDVSSLERGRSVDAIRHYNGERTITLTARVDRSISTPVEVSGQMRRLLADFSQRYPGYGIDYSGEFEEFEESANSLIQLGLIGLLLVYLILGAQFRSFVQPVIIIGFTFPGALLGSALALFITQTPLSITTLYGVVALLGIVVNDSLVFISFINRARRDGAPVEEAIAEAGRVRLRPIVLTTVTTVFGLLPMAIGLGGESATWGPLATTIVWGLTIATATTLFVIPPVYRCVVDLLGLAAAVRAVLFRRTPRRSRPGRPRRGVWRHRRGRLMRAALLVTCLADQLWPEVAAATVRVLRRLGVEVEVPPGQTCCGQPALNAGHRAEAARAALHTLWTFQHAEVVVAPSGSCVAMLRHHLVALVDEVGSPEEREAARALAQRIFELSEFLTDRLGVDASTLTGLGARGVGRVAVHPGCHLDRELGVDVAGALLEGVDGIEVVEQSDRSGCCGFGGLFALEQPEVSAGLLGRKCDALADSGAETVVGCDASCLLHIEGGLSRAGSPLRVRHLAEVLDEALRAGGEP